MRIQDKLGEIVGGELKIETDDNTEFVLKPTMLHKRKIQFLQKKFADNSYKEEDLKIQDDQVIDIIKTSYPELGEREVQAIMMTYGGELLLELLFAWKLRDKEAFDVYRQAQKNKLEEIKKHGIDGKPQDVKPST